MCCCRLSLSLRDSVFFFTIVSVSWYLTRLMIEVLAFEDDDDDEGNSKNWFIKIYHVSFFVLSATAYAVLALGAERKSRKTVAVWLVVRV